MNNKESPPPEAVKSEHADLSSPNFDEILLAQIEARKQQRRRRRFIFKSVAAFCIIGIIAAYLCVHRGTTDSSTRINFADKYFSENNLDSGIDNLEQQLQKPGRAIDYYLLGEGLRRRFAERGNNVDSQRSAQSFHRADELFKKELTEVDMKNKMLLFSLGFLLVIGGVMSLVALSSYNKLATADEQADGRWGQVEAVLQRRLDLVPQLVETVRGYANHEEKTLTNITNARSRLSEILAGKTARTTPEERVRLTGQFEHEFQDALRSLAVVVESYPNLKASSNFVTLQEQLEGTENRINTERIRFNDAVQEYNSALRRFPGALVGVMFGFSARSYFEAAHEAHSAVKIGFSSSEQG